MSATKVNIAQRNTDSFSLNMSSSTVSMSFDEYKNMIINEEYIKTYSDNNSESSLPSIEVKKVKSDQPPPKINV